MSNIYKILTDVLHSGNFDLGEKLESIQYYQVHGELTLEQMEELVSLAREKAKPQYNPDQDFEQVLQMLHNLDERVTKLEMDGGEPSPADYPEYVAGKWYYNGDGCTFEGKKYDCIAPEGVVCVWSPAEYPAYWEKEDD